MSLRVGCELEVPLAQQGGYKRKCGKDSHGIVDSAYIGGPERSFTRREMKYDSTVGLEITSDALDIEKMKKWYRYVFLHVDHVHRKQIEPTGRLDNGSTAGLHQHLSPIGKDVAEELYNFSWGNLAKLCFCTSFVLRDLKADLELNCFRGGNYCDMYFDHGHYSVVNCASRHDSKFDEDDEHWEWRLPEPMEPDNYDVMMDFLGLWYARSLGTAEKWLREVFQKRPQMFTSLNRLASIAAWKAVNVSRSALIDALQAKMYRSGKLFPTDFGQSVRQDKEAPIIYLVKMGKNKKAYYLLISKKG